MPVKSETPAKSEPKAIKDARAAAREKFSRFRDDDGAPATVDPENPPLTDEQWAEMRPAHEVNPELVTAFLRRKGGRPRATSPKTMVSIRLDSDLVDSLRASGEGWQSRVNEILRLALSLSRASAAAPRKTDDAR